jgi:hypothetical protein
MTDSRPTDAQTDAQDALLSIIKDGVQALRGNGHRLDNNIAGIKVLAEAYNLVVERK